MSTRAIPASRALTRRRVLFPGALNSEFTNTLEFLQPSKSKGAISTYRCLNQYGEIMDKTVGADTTDEEALELYKNMVKRRPTLHTPCRTGT
jgi:2-oxoisovalerate dehydrogenase E1 component alpha subunit